MAGVEELRVRVAEMEAKLLGSFSMVEAVSRKVIDESAAIHQSALHRFS